MGTLRTKMEQDLAVRGIRPRTGHNYLRFVADLTRHYGRAPDALTLSEVEAYLVHLRQVRQLTPGASRRSSRGYASSTTSRWGGRGPTSPSRRRGRRTGSPKC